MVESVLNKKNTSYEFYFAKVLAKRLKFLNNINALVAIFISISLAIPFGSFWWNIFMTLIYRGPLIFIALLLIKLSRDYNTVVEYSPYKTLGLQIYYTVFSKTFILNCLFYLFSSLITYFVYIMQCSFRSDYYLISKEYQRKPILNDEWIYYWFYSVYIAILYTAQHLIFQRNRLFFEYGVSKAKPEDTLWKKLPNIIGTSIFLNTVIGISGPIVYWFVRPLIYKINLALIMILGFDTSTPSFHISLKTFFSTLYLSFHVLICWEIVNHIYEVYSKIGCLDGKKPISAYSSDPINTLLSGLRNVDKENQLSRLTAFQELAYIATTADPEGVALRTAVFNAHSKGGFIWPAILNECSLVIREVTSRINYRSSFDLDIFNQDQNKLKDEYKNLFNSDSGKEIFGNSYFREDASKVDAPVNNLKKYSTEETNNERSSRFKNMFKFFKSQVIAPINSIFASLFVANSNSMISSQLKVNSHLSDIRNSYRNYRNQFLSTSIGIFFRTTLKRDTESRIINSVNFGNSIIAASNFLIHSTKEDKHSTVTNNNIGEILNLLEKPVRATRNYTDYLPASVYLSNGQKESKSKKNHLIALLHDLAINEFFHICIIFNYKLNDLVLNARTFKLAKWVIDLTIAQQQNQQKRSVKKDVKVNI